MFRKILVANRGEIACRVIATAKKMGIATVAVYSDADRQALHVKRADEAIHIGAAASQESYLRGDRIIAAALKTGAQAIHPGYGFLSENADFAHQCAENNLVFIGPPASAIESMGSKSAAKNIMQEAGVPLVPGYHGDDQNPKLLKASADEMGYPVLLKAVAGGGGKGMRQVWSADEFDRELEAAKREAKSSFNNDDMLVEKYLTQPRHVEVQVFCDQHGNGVYLFERDCSVQRRHQKIIEEAPAPGLSEKQRQEMGEAAVKAAQAINYVGAGTVEFLFDSDGSFYFMEMNTRLQVEHPVTEMITGQDLVEWQLKVADGQSLPKQQDQLQISGHAFEARIYAEDPENQFLPTAGHLSHLSPPLESEHIRVDTGVLAGDDVSPYYDPMIAKLIVWDDSREAALNRLTTALRQYQIFGVTTNIDFLHRLAKHPSFEEADLDTGFIEKHKEALFPTQSNPSDSDLALIAAFLVLKRSADSADLDQAIWQDGINWRMNQPNSQLIDFCIDELDYSLKAEQLDSNIGTKLLISYQATEQNEHSDFELNVEVQLDGENLLSEISGHKSRSQVISIGDNFVLFNANGKIEFSQRVRVHGSDSAGSSDKDFKAPMNGTVIEVLVKPGDSVEEGDALVIMEAMKMQHTITAPTNGTVTELYCESGELVDGGSELLAFETS